MVKRLCEEVRHLISGLEGGSIGTFHRGVERADWIRTHGANPDRKDAGKPELFAAGSRGRQALATDK
jgi:hypothetical protein